jgi:hypothetical protein
VKDTHALTTVPPAHPSHAALGWRSTTSPDYTRINLLQICKQVVTRLLSSRYQEVFRTECSRLFCTRLITAVTDLLTTSVTYRQYQICWDSFLRVRWPHRPCHKMKTTCSNTKTSCWRRQSLFQYEDILLLLRVRLWQGIASARKTYNGSVLALSHSGILLASVSLDDYTTILWNMDSYMNSFLCYREMLVMWMYWISVQMITVFLVDRMIAHWS